MGYTEHAMDMKGLLGSRLPEMKCTRAHVQEGGTVHVLRCERSQKHDACATAMTRHVCC